jgi:hypothetical protein
MLNAIHYSIDLSSVKNAKEYMPPERFIRFAKKFIQECKHELHLQLFETGALEAIAKLTQPVAVWALLDSLGEFIANSFDADATSLQILCAEGRTKIDLIDNGGGFDPEKFFEAGQTNTNYLDFVARNDKHKRADDEDDVLVHRINSEKKPNMLGGMGMGLLRLATVLNHIDPRNIVLCAQKLDGSDRSIQGAITTLQTGEMSMSSLQFTYAQQAALSCDFMVTATERFDPSIYAEVTSEQIERIRELMGFTSDKEATTYLDGQREAVTHKKPPLSFDFEKLSLDLRFDATAEAEAEAGAGTGTKCVTPFREVTDPRSFSAASSVSVTSPESDGEGGNTTPAEPKNMQQPLEFK